MFKKAVVIHPYIHIRVYNLPCYTLSFTELQIISISHYFSLNKFALNSFIIVSLYHRLPAGMTCLLLALSETSSVSSMASLCDALCLTFARVLGNFKLSLDECIEFMILGLMAMVVHELLSLHHLEKFGNLLLQHLQQQQ